MGVELKMDKSMCPKCSLFVKKEFKLNEKITE